MSAEGRERVEQLALVWRSLDELCSGLSDEEWALPTDCPGWSVQDQLAHVSGTEAMILGRSADHQAPSGGHVRNPLGERNEIEVDFRRTWSPHRVLEEFRAVTAERLAGLRALDDDGFAAPSWTPAGRTGTVADLLGFRLYDGWVHEQDIRHAVGRPGHVDGPVAEYCTARTLTVLPRSVARDAGAPDGTTVVFDLTGPLGRTVAVTVEGGRGRLADLGPGVDVPGVRVTAPAMVFLRLSWGRVAAAEALAGGHVRVDGDAALGRAVVEHLNFML